jgi:D-alanyl-D-alanine carboxypeptidase/D-alanyl-D-alanine-endopeptidase (penicillin-binding protein 4)
MSRTRGTAVGSPQTKGAAPSGDTPDGRAPRPAAPPRRGLGGRVALAAAAILSAATAHAGVKETVDAVLQDPYFRKVDVGIQIVRLGDKPGAGETLYERNPDTPLIPASNLKLVTTAAVLSGLGRDFAFRTSLVSKAGVVALVGDGDPALGDAELLSGTGESSTTMFDAWAKALADRGLKKIDRVLHDASVFDRTFTHPDWPENQLQKRYVAGVAGLNFNANCLDFYLKPGAGGQVVTFVQDPPARYGTVANRCVSGKENAVWLSREIGTESIVLRGETDGPNAEPISVTVHNPPALAATVLHDALRRGGIEITDAAPGDVALPRPFDDWQVLAVHETPLAQVLWRANKDSMNVYAEAFCKRLGAQVSGQPGSWANGTAAVGAYLQSIGVPANQFTIVDGCGLARGNRLAPAALIRVLECEALGENADVYLGSLSVAGTDGTLKARFPRGGEQVIGKSGFIDGVSSLTGFVNDSGGRRVAFSILFNGIDKGTNAKAKAFQEQIVRAIK